MRQAFTRLLAALSHLPCLLCQMSFPGLELVLFLLWFWSHILQLLVFPNMKQIVYNKCLKCLIFRFPICCALKQTIQLIRFCYYTPFIHTRVLWFSLVLVVYLWFLTFYALGMVLLWFSGSLTAFFLFGGGRIPYSSPIQSAMDNQYTTINSRIVLSPQKKSHTYW